MQKTFYSHSFGCRVNQAEKEALDKQLSSLGYRFDPQNPDIYIINSCAVTHKAEREARQLVYQIRRSYPDIKIVVTGCAATNWLKRGVDVPEIDYLVDNQNKEYIAELITKQVDTQEPQQHTSQPVVVPDKYTKSGRIIIKIQDGCNRFCSFCIVPYLRGLPKSRSTEAIIQHINEADPSTKEVILTAINTEAFGYDSKESFVNLLTQVVEQTTVPRISFGSIHPWSFRDEFFEAYAKLIPARRLVNFFHIPLQSGCNKILTLMKRGYTREEFLQKLDRLNAMEPFTFIGTDIIVGYLEETDKDFEDTYDFLSRAPISKFHIFRFSKRQHTAAFHMAKRLMEPTPDAKLKRAKALAELNKRKYNTFLESHVGNRFSALILEKGEDGYQHALLSNQMAAIIKVGGDKVGEIVDVSVEEYKEGKLVGSVA
ncbi:MAG: hypothetical protein RI947_523 [Candidatus Parcubacteria bacterium]|jgi:threonylcarbamoyladenosine tRNA methylthiotransferase MtaB